MNFSVSSGGVQTSTLGHAPSAAMQALAPQLRAIDGGLSPDHATVREFCERFGGENGMSLVSIQSGPLRGRYFDPHEYGAASDWACQQNRNGNVYFSLATPTVEAAKLAASGKKVKLQKADVEAVAWVWVDIDPPAHADLELWQADVLAELEKFDLPPTLIILSGGGIWACWKLREPFHIGGDKGRAKEFERYTRGIANRFKSSGGDSAFDICRIARMPGTVNWPNAPKIAKGRKPALASIHSWRDEREYDLSDFTPWAIDHGAVVSSRAHPAVDLANLPTINSLDDVPQLRADSNPRMRLLIETGNAAATEKQYPSRSQVVFAAACMMIRANVPDPTIFAIITDVRFPISAHILDQKDWVRAATRTIERAHQCCGQEHAESSCPELAELNAKHAVVQVGSKTLIATFEADPLTNLEELRFSEFEHFARRYSNRFVELPDDKRMLLAKWWLMHEHRRQYDGFVLSPSADVPGYLNTWRGFAVTAARGSCLLLLRHIREIVCGSDRTLYKYVLRWCAWAIQNPGLPAETAIVLLGEEGIGKGTFATVLTEIFGTHGRQIGSSDKFLGKYSDHLAHLCFVFADEAINPDSKGEEARLKSYITERRIFVEGKFRDPIEVENHLKIIIASNNDKVIPAGPTARRFVVCEVSKKMLGNRQYFHALKSEIKKGGTAAFFHFLSRVPLGHWHPREDVPKTGALRRQQVQNLAGVEAAFHDMLATGLVPMVLDYSDQKATNKYAPGCRVSTLTLRGIATSQARYRITSNDVATFLSKLRFKKQDDSPRGYELPALAHARAAWDRAMFPVAWPDCPEWQAMPGDKF